MVKSMGIIRKVDEIGRVVLPIEARKMFDIEENDSLEISVDEESGHIILKKTTNMCLKCRATKNLREIKPGYYICKKCIKELG